MIIGLRGKRLGGVLSALCYLLSVGAAVGLSRVLPVPQPGGAGGPPTRSTAGLHLPQARRVSFTYHLTDGAGFRWDVQYYGTVGSGTNSAFSGAMYCRVNGSNVRSSGTGWVSAAGDEVEIGPYSRSSLRCYRRIKAYRDMGLARWLDILENPTTQNITVQIQIHTNRNYTIRNATTSSGTGVFGPRDWAVVTTSSGSNSPAVLHILCGKHAKTRPAVQVQGNSIYARYNLTVPAGRTVVLCHFLSQAHSAAEHLKTMRTFRPYRVLKDLPPTVRKLLVNFASAGGFEGVELDRSETTDTVILRTGDPIYGRITNKTYAVRAFFGPLELPAEQVVGMAAGAEPSGHMRFALRSGQVVSGKSAETKLAVALPAGGTLEIPLEDIRQWSYRITAERPSREESSEPFLVLRTGDRLAFDPTGLAMGFRTRHGRLPLDPAVLQELVLDNRGNAVHRAVFRNGSRLAGFLEPQRLTFQLKLGAKLAVPRHTIVRIRLAPEPKRDPALSAVRLSNGDELYGRILAAKIRLVTRYNPVELVPENVKSIVRDGQAVVEMWNGTVHKGRLGQTEIAFQIVPGPRLSLHAEQVASIARPKPLPPKKIRRLVEELVARLGAESYKDRQEATERLMQLQGIRSLLAKHLNHSDPEVRHRIEEILAKSRDQKVARPPQPPVRPGEVFLGPRR